MLRFSAVIAIFSSMTAAAYAEAVRQVTIITMNDTPQLVEVKDGVIKGLSERGYTDGKNIKIDFKSAQGNFGTAQQIARQVVGNRPDVIVTITTPASQAVVATAKDVPVVFTTVTDPLHAKLISKIHKPGGNVTGISDLIPTERQLELVREIVPSLKTLGLVYDPGLDNSRSTVEGIRGMASRLGLTLVESPAMGLNNVPSAGQNLVGKVDAIFVPNDTTVYAAFEALVKIPQDTKTPLFTAERRSVQRGAIATIGYDFGEMGKMTAGIVDQILKGTKPGDIDVVYMKDLPGALSLYVNKASAEKMGVKVPNAVLDRAAQIF